MISRCMELSMGRGRDRKLKGSKRALMWPHVLHFTWDLSWPWNRSTTMERFLRRWFSHAWREERHQQTGIHNMRHTQHQHNTWCWSAQNERSIKTTHTQIRTRFKKCFISLLLTNIWNTTPESKVNKELGHVTDRCDLLPRCVLLQYRLLSLRFGFCGAGHVYSL